MHGNLPQKQLGPFLPNNGTGQYFLTSYYTNFVMMNKAKMRWVERGGTCCPNTFCRSRDLVPWLPCDSLGTPKQHKPDTRTSAATKAAVAAVIPCTFRLPDYSSSFWY